MAPHPLAGRPAPADILIDPEALVREYHDRRPDPDDPTQRVAFGTSGHRGSPLDGSFTEAHILATTQAICDWRRAQRIDGPLFLGKDTHAVSPAAERTALEVLAANAVPTIVQANGGYTPTPVVSRAILVHNRGRTTGLADGIVVTPSHNPPEDGGFKYNPPHGGPADTAVTGWNEQTPNELLADGNRHVKRLPYARALAAATTQRWDFVGPYVAGLADVVDMEAIRGAKLRIAGKGGPGQAGGPPGHIYLLVTVTPDRAFSREGDDLLVEVTIHFSEATLGSSLEVPTMEGTKRLKVPAGIQPGTKLRLKGHGFPRLGESGRGDLYVRVQVTVPEHLTPRQRALVEELAKEGL